MMELNIRKDQWVKVTLLDVFIKKEENDKENARNRFDRFLKVEHMDAESLHIKRWASQENGDELNPYFYKIFRKGQILFPTRNPHLRRTVLASFDGICGEKTLTLEPIEDLVIPEFIPFLFHSESFYAHTTGAIIGSTNPHVRWRDVANYEFLLPPKDQQAQLAELLWAMDEVVEREREVFKHLDFLFKSKAKFISDNHIHTGEYKKVKQVCLIKDNLRKPINSSERDSMKGETPYYGANGVVDYLNDYIFDEDLVLLAEDGGNFNEFYCKEIAYKISGKSWVNNHAHVLSVESSKVPIDWIYYSLVHKNILKYIIGTTRLKLNKSELENILIWIPDERKIEKLSLEMKESEDARKQADSKVINSQALQKSLINQIF